MTSSTAATPIGTTGIRRYPPLGTPADDAGTGLPDVACVVYYRQIRSGVRPGAAQIGYGVNKVPPCGLVRHWLSALYRRLLVDRVTDYESSADQRERAIVARLAARYLAAPDLGPDNVVLCNGTTEAISVVFSFAGQRGWGAVLPLPVYCSFEQSAARHDVPVTAYYNMTGDVRDVGSAATGEMVVDIAPNGVIGGWFDVSAVATRAGAGAMRVVDHVFALPTFVPPADFLATLRARVGPLDEAAVLLSPSKDLSIPGLRCGTIVTKMPDLLAFTRADRFERGYSVQVGLGRVAAAHLALLLIAFAGDDEVAGLERELRIEFAAADLPWIGAVGVSDFRRHIGMVRERFQANAVLMDESGLLPQFPGTTGAVAGYSGLRALSRPFASADAFTRWVTRTGGAGLKLNPSYLFGGDDELWTGLYGGGYGVRVNFSVPPDELVPNLALLADRLRA